MAKINLSNNQKRSISASLHIVEKSVNELERELNRTGDLIMFKVINDTGDLNLQEYKLLIQQIKSHIRYLADKYCLQPTSLPLSQIINAQKSNMWVILCDTRSNSMKGYGEFPKELAEEFDSDIDILQDLIDRL
jgi:hypothetical protein